MRVIVAHENIDLDGLGSLALARRLHPGARAVVHGPIEGQSRAAYSLYKGALELLTPDDLPNEDIEELIVVDTHDFSRLGPFQAAAQRGPTVVYDHHPRSAAAPAGHYRDTGSCVTLLAAELSRSGLEPTRDEATLALAGLQADTNFLRSAHTVRLDFEMAGWLARHADLETLRGLVSEPLSEEALRALAELIGAPHWRDLGRFRVIVQELEGYGRLPGAVLAARLLSLTGADAVILLLPHEGQTDAVGRAAPGGPDLGRLMRELDGGGHAQAASARSALSPRDLEARLLRSSVWNQRGETVAERMTRDVRGLQVTLSVGEAALELARLGHSGAPVVEGEQLVGVVSRRDLERALRHGLTHTPLASVMTRDVLTVCPDDPLEHAADLIKRRSVGRLPVLEAGRVVGILTRSDLLGPPAPPQGLEERILENLRPTDRAVLARLRDLAPPGAQLSLVGGAVRDALLGRAPADLDVVVSGADVFRITERAASGGLNFVVHPRYNNATLKLEEGATLDLVQARDEYYEAPGVPPTVVPGNLLQDLSRRDFSVNALALQIAPQERFVDAFGGLEDLEAGVLRVLHPLSFLEDPSRIVRGARLAARLAFRLHEAARESIAAALAGAAAAQVRLRSELDLIFGEPFPGAVMETLQRWGAAALYGPNDSLAALHRADAAKAAGEEVQGEVYRALWLHGVRGDRAEYARHWQFPRRTLELSYARLPENLTEEAWRLSDLEVRFLSLLHPQRAAELEVARNLQPRRVRGQDVLDLGVSPGPEVGQALEYLNGLRRAGRVRSFDDEMQALRAYLNRTPGAGG
ncbi:tRNA nucleotidyltransferase (CCA-adding enzyme) [Deinobacterium chartae]|uniref:tRNA nucleotidyltransferase (CCA-adding enzyme) n=1 Tax=Deinobacterium chartae TaxID=521158 RepID=A0A841HXE5_9DEIO|nr:CBS domain-containing protein [Deinobacterium chartae]MBB6097324.1 tRNA nucleotidyltransferase (CCA-adding enzyme) [Deinobacterium chartae]